MSEPATKNTGAPDAALRDQVEISPRLREVWDPSRHRAPVVVGGDPDGWAAVKNALEAAGVEARAYLDHRWRVPKLRFGGRAVHRGRDLPGPLASCRMLFAGTPHKRWFNPASSALERCMWHVRPIEWRARGPHQPKLLEQHGHRLGRVFAALHDESSRAIYASIVRARLEGDTGFQRVSHHREYDHPVVRARPGEVVIDAGAYTGKSALLFLRQMRWRGTVVAMEPSLSSYRKLIRWPVPGLLPVAVGAWSESATLAFEEGGASGKIRDDRGSNHQGAVVHVTAIDRLVRELGLPRVDLLKFDVEGAEDRALEGAKETLERHRPKVQLSIYHQRRDLYTLPLRLMDALPGYRFYLGHHGFYQTETDLYAIPEERLTPRDA